MSKDTGDEGRDKPAEIDQLFIQWDPGGGGARAPSAPFGGWADGARWCYSEVIPNGKLFRSRSEW